MTTIINEMQCVTVDLSAPSIEITPDVCYGAGLALWLQIPGIFLHKKPKKWEIRLEYEDDTVKICGTSEVGCLNADNNANEALEAFRKVLALDGFILRQPH